MPIFEYICKQCDHHFEALVTAGGQDESRCPKCESKKLEQQFSAFAVGAPRGRGQFAKSAPSGGGCGTCGDPRGPGSCSN